MADAGELGQRTEAKESDMKALSEAIVGGVLALGGIALLAVRGPYLVDVIDLGGTVQAYQAADVRPQVAGRIIQIAFAEGQQLKKGDLIAVLEARPYEDALERAQATLANDRAILERQQLILDRDMLLAANGDITMQLLKEHESTVAQAEATLKADQAALDSARTRLEYTKITAPFDGIAGLREVDVGNLVYPTDAHGIVLMTQVQPISVVFTLPSWRLHEVQAALGKGPLVADAWDERNQQLLDTGTLQAIDNQVNQPSGLDQASGVIRLKGVFQNSRLLLWPGSVVHVHLWLDTRNDAAAVPSATAEGASSRPSSML